MKPKTTTNPQINHAKSLLLNQYIESIREAEQEYNDLIKLVSPGDPLRSHPQEAQFRRILLSRSHPQEAQFRRIFLSVLDAKERLVAGVITKAEWAEAYKKGCALARLG